MLKVLINEEEVLTNKDFTIKKEMLNTPSVILNNVYPKTWEDTKDYTSNFYHPQDYSKCKIIDENVVPAEPGETISGTSFTIQDNDNTKLNELTELDGNTTQSGTPTPDSPQPINVVSGRQEVSVVGKNLMNPEYAKGSVNGSFVYDNDIYTFTPSSTNVNARIVFLIPKTMFKVGTTYTIKAVGSDRIAVGYASAVNDTSHYTYFTNVGDTNNVSFTYSEIPTDYVNIYLYNRNSTLGTDWTLSEVQLNEGSTATEYEQFKGQSYEINLGKNLLDLTDGTYDNEIVATVQNGIITLNGTTTANRFVWIALNTNLVLTNGENYTITTNNDTANSNLRLRLDNSGTYDTILNNINDTKLITYSSDNSIYGNTISIRVASGTTLTDYKIKPQIEKGSVATTYAPYKTPIELCKINTYKDMIFKGSGVNLFDKDNANILQVNLNNSTTISGNSTSNRTLYIPIQPNTTYTISKIISNYFVIGTTESLPQRNLAYYQRQANASANSLTITTNSTAKYLICWFWNSSDTLTEQQILDSIQLEKGSTATPYEPYNSKGKWLLHKEIGKVVLDGSEANWNSTSGNAYIPITDALGTNSQTYSTYFVNSNTSQYGNYKFGGSNNWCIFLSASSYHSSLANFKTWLSTHNTIVYYVLKTPTTEEITDSELISQLESIELLEGLNNVSVSSGDLPGEITIHYNYTEEQTIDDLLFCGVVKNSGNISLNPREPHYSSLQILDFKTFLSEGELDSFVIYQKTILEAIQMVIANIQDYGFILGNVNILNPTDIIGAYSTKDKTAYDVFNYIADITQSRWTTRLIDENHVAIDFYDPTLMIEGTPINYTQAFFENNLIDDMTYSYGSNNYRNKQVMTSSQVYSNISQQQSIVANGYQTQFPTEQPIGKINSITSNGIPLTFATFNEKDMGYVADFYYSPGDNYFESEDLRTTGEILIIDYVAIVEGRQIITNPLEIDRINESTGRKGIISRYEQRNDATTSTELQKIGESYIKYKGTPEIKLKISTRSNIWEVGQRVQFNAPIEELDTEYMVRTKKINYISTIDTIFYEYELISSFNSETEINYFDNQRAKASGNIGEGEYISRNIDIESTANIIFYDTETTEVQVDGDNELNVILNSPFTS